MQLVKSWKRFSTTTILLICMCSYFILTRYTSDIPLTYYAAASTGDIGKGEKQGGKRPGHLSLKLPNDEQPRISAAPRWTYKCQNQACIRTLVDQIETEEESILSFDVCWLTCGSHGPVWPHPKHEIMKGSETVKFLPENIHVKIKADSETVRILVQEAVDLKIKVFENHRSPQSAKLLWFFPTDANTSKIGYKIQLSIQVRDSNDIFTLDTDEAYELKIEEKLFASEQTLEISIKGKTFFGVRHGIETLSQLIATDTVDNSLQIVKKYSIMDAPAFPYRGVLIDTARNYIGPKVIERVVDAMSYNKLNILHWHLSDSNSFSFHSDRVPQMTEYGALPNQIYNSQQVKDLVKYARVRGVKIIPELDAPSHAGNGWQFGEKGI